MIGGFLESDWTEDAIVAAEENLETAAAEETEPGEDASLWASVWDSVFMNLSEENVMNWVTSMQTGAEEGYQQVLETEDQLSNLLEGIFSAFVGGSAE